MDHLKQMVTSLQEDMQRLRSEKSKDAGDMAVDEVAETAGDMHLAYSRRINGHT